MTNQPTLRTDPASGTAYYGDTPFSVSPREMTLLQVLRDRAPRVVTRQELRELVWAGTDTNARTIDVYVSRLRHRLTEIGHPGIETVYQRGYRLLEVEES